MKVLFHLFFLDYTATKWRVNNETGKRERQVTYKVLAQLILGTNTISCTEKQVYFIFDIF
jgi:hypothetical protein